jgi:hypothetical protein
VARACAGRRGATTVSICAQVCLNVLRYALSLCAVLFLYMHSCDAPLFAAHAADAAALRIDSADPFFGKGCAQSRCRCGRVSSVPLQTWQACAQSRASAIPASGRECALACVVGANGGLPACHLFSGTCKWRRLRRSFAGFLCTRSVYFVACCSVSHLCADGSLPTPCARASGPRGPS